MKKFVLLFASVLLISASSANSCYAQAYKTYTKKPAAKPTPASKPVPASAIAAVTPDVTPAPAGPAEVSIAILSSSLPNAKVLMKGLDKNVRVFVARDEESMADLFKRITLKCEKSNEVISTIAVFSYGKSGEFALGADKISPRNLKFIGEDFEAISPRLTTAPKLLIYSSETGTGKNGDKLLTSLADIFPGSIYMSNNLTGMGGDWNLEVSNTDAPAPVLVDSNYLDKYYKFAVGK